MNTHFPIKDFYSVEIQSVPLPPPDFPDTHECEVLGDTFENAVWGD